MMKPILRLLETSCKPSNNIGAAVRMRIAPRYEKRAFSASITSHAKNNSKAKKDNKGSSSSPDSASPGISLESVLEDSEKASEKAMSKLTEQIKLLRSGRQDPGKLTRLKIPSENTTLNTLAAVTQKNPKTFLVTVYDPVHVKQISAAIASSGQNFNPQPVPNNPTQLTINIPSESTLVIGAKVKDANKFGLAAKDAIRHARGDAVRAIRASKTSSDERSPFEKQVHTNVKTYTEQIDKLVDDTRKALAP